jgi:hypothetical protein
MLPLKEDSLVSRQFAAASLPFCSSSEPRSRHGRPLAFDEYWSSMFVSGPRV